MYYSTLKYNVLWMFDILNIYCKYNYKLVLAFSRSNKPVFKYREIGSVQTKLKIL